MSCCHCNSSSDHTAVDMKAFDKYWPKEGQMGVGEQAGFSYPVTSFRATPEVCDPSSVRVVLLRNETSPDLSSIFFSPGIWKAL